MFEELYAIAYFGIGLILLLIILGGVQLYELYLDKREHNVDHNMDIRNIGSDSGTIGSVGDNNWK